ncbi:GtrA family protein [Oceanobacillus damuensis]|uniref:GtrA family protein n=1 Tax=Oceanobacillus damuensis TaxID=937928 RepID=UPI0008328618|nr:GtrA family protein [Oceanobacillus damuensis]
MPKKPKRKETVLEIMQFSAIGGSNALIDIGALNLMLFVWPTNDNQLLLLFNTIAYTLAVTNSYVFNANLTFRKRSIKNKKEIIFFSIQALASLIISNIVFIGGSALLGLLPIPVLLQHNIAKGAAMVLSSSASFFFMRYFVFQGKTSKINK